MNPSAPPGPSHHWKGPERVLFGHTVFDRPLVTEHAVGIDTGGVLVSEAF